MNTQIRADVFGWFDSRSSTIPAHDPTVEAGTCPICGEGLSRPVVTTSLMKQGDTDRSYFFRCHKSCHQDTSEEEMNLLESSLIDSLP